ncbi:hypothetical protein [Streptomyces sp. NPDC088752]|uniref:hypothetical protein n=1 Tax=Streptomyces sp. NPDC088752 TaxID=3154963 RepID=UPI00342ECC8E
MTPLTAEELRERLGPPADTWPGQGLVVTSEGDRIEVRDGKTLIGWVAQKEFPHLGKSLPTFSAAITMIAGEPWGIEFPGGWLPEDPKRARHSEQQRWLPQDHPDNPAKETA